MIYFLVSLVFLKQNELPSLYNDEFGTVIIPVGSTSLYFEHFVELRVGPFQNHNWTSHIVSQNPVLTDKTSKLPNNHLISKITLRIGKIFPKISPATAFPPDKGTQKTNQKVVKYRTGMRVF